MTILSDISNDDFARAAAMKFGLGELTVTERAAAVMRDAQVMATVLLAEHHDSYWGGASPEMDPETGRARRGIDRLCTAFDLGSGAVCVVTEADQSLTRIVTPDEL